MITASVHPIKFWKKYFLGVEAGAAFALAGGICVWFFWFDGDCRVDVIMDGNRANVYQSIATIAGALLGFAIASTSIAFGFSSNDRLTLLRGSQHYGQFWDVFFQTIYSLGALTIVGLICLVADKETSPKTYLILPLVLFAALSVARLTRVIWLLERVIRILTER